MRSYCSQTGIVETEAPTEVVFITATTPADVDKVGRKVSR